MPIDGERSWRLPWKLGLTWCPWCLYQKMALQEVKQGFTVCRTCLLWHGFFTGRLTVMRNVLIG
jgi:hypothetical protein